MLSPPGIDPGLAGPEAGQNALNVDPTQIGLIALATTVAVAYGAHRGVPGGETIAIAVAPGIKDAAGKVAYTTLWTANKLADKVQDAGSNLAAGSKVVAGKVAYEAFWHGDKAVDQGKRAAKKTSEAGKDAYDETGSAARLGIIGLHKHIAATRRDRAEKRWKAKEDSLESGKEMALARREGSLPDQSRVPVTGHQIKRANKVAHNIRKSRHKQIKTMRKTAAFGNRDAHDTKYPAVVKGVSKPKIVQKTVGSGKHYHFIYDKAASTTTVPDNDLMDDTRRTARQKSGRYTRRHIKAENEAVKLARKNDKYIDRKARRIGEQAAGTDRFGRRSTRAVRRNQTRANKMQWEIIDLNRMRRRELNDRRARRLARRNRP